MMFRALRYAAACCSCAAASGWICSALLYAAVCCTCAVTSCGLAVMMCCTLIYAAVCCASTAASGGLANTKMLYSSDNSISGSQDARCSKSAAAAAARLARCLPGRNSGLRSWNHAGPAGPPPSPTRAEIQVQVGFQVASSPPLS